MADREIKIPITGDSSGYKKALAEAEQATGKFGKATEGAGKALKAAFVGGAAVAGIHDVIDAASDYNETVSKSKVIFGEAAKGATDFAEGAAESFGLSQQSALDAEATFATFGKSAGLAGDELVGFSKDLTGLAADMGSFSNTSPEQAIEAIGAALRGESEPIRAYGVLLDDATLRASALSLGIYDGNGALTAQQKVLAAQKSIFEQTGDAQGDFARTSDGLAGQTKILSAKFENLKVTLGSKLLPVATAVISGFLDMTGAASNLAFGTDLATDSFKKFFENAEVHTIKEISDTLHAMSKAADEAGGFIDRLWGFDAGDSKWGLLNENFKKIGEESPEAIRKVYDELVKVKKAADDGDPAARKLAEDYELTTGHLDDLYDAYIAVSPEIAETDRETRRLTAGTALLVPTVEELKEKEDAAKLALQQYKEMSGRWADSVKADVDEVQAEWDELTGDINDDKTWLNLQTSFDELGVKVTEAWTATAKGADDAEQATRDAKVAVDDQKLAVIEYGKEVLGLPPERLTNILALIDQGALAEAEEALRILTRDRGAGIFAEVRTVGNSGGGFATAAEGGIVTARPGGQLVLAGEAGHDEALIPLDGNHAIGGGTPTIGEVHIHVQSMPSPDQLIAIVQKFEARNGAGWRS